MWASCILLFNHLSGNLYFLTFLTESQELTKTLCQSAFSNGVGERNHKDWLIYWFKKIYVNACHVKHNNKKVAHNNNKIKETKRSRLLIHHLQPINPYNPLTPVLPYPNTWHSWGKSQPFTGFLESQKVGGCKIPWGKVFHSEEPAIDKSHFQSPTRWQFYRDGIWSVPTLSSLVE